MRSGFPWPMHAPAQPEGPAGDRSGAGAPRAAGLAAAVAQDTPVPVDEPESVDTVAIPNGESSGGSPRERPALTGDWGGARDRLAARGYTLEFITTGFFQGVVDGGADETSEAGGRADAYLTVDGEKAGLWQGLFLGAHAEYMFGENVNDEAGALFPVNFALAVPRGQPDVFAITGLTATQFLSENFLLYGGKLNTVDDSNQPYRRRDGALRLHERLAAAVSDTGANDPVFHLGRRVCLSS